MALALLCDHPTCRRQGEQYTINSRPLGTFRVVLCERHSSALRTMREIADLAEQERKKPQTGSRTVVDTDYLTGLIERKKED